jgi:hypothetical protein
MMAAIISMSTPESIRPLMAAIIRSPVSSPLTFQVRVICDDVVDVSDGFMEVLIDSMRMRVPK